MHLAIREDRKTVTRRVIKLRGKAYKFMREHGYDSLQHDEVVYPDGGGNWIGWDKDSPGLAEFTKKAYPNGEGFKSPYQVGDVVYIKEAFMFYKGADAREGWIGTPQEVALLGEPPHYLYKLDDTEITKEYGKHYKWRSPLFMPQKAARDFIQITGVRAERLQEIGGEYGFGDLKELRAEGLLYGKGWVRGNADLPMRYNSIDAYSDLWDSINKEHPWASNPWLWRYEFKRVERP